MLTQIESPTRGLFFARQSEYRLSRSPRISSVTHACVCGLARKVSILKRSFALSQPSLPWQIGAVGKAPVDTICWFSGKICPYVHPQSDIKQTLPVSFRLAPAPLFFNSLLPSLPARAGFYRKFGRSASKRILTESNIVIFELVLCLPELAYSSNDSPISDAARTISS